MKNTIFSNPKGWAAKAVGSRFRHGLMQSLTLLFGVLLAIMVYFICREARLPLFVYLGVLVALIIAAVELPLYYLRALRFYVVEHQGTNHEVS